MDKKNNSIPQNAAVVNATPATSGRKLTADEKKAALKVERDRIAEGRKDIRRAEYLFGLAYANILKDELYEGEYKSAEEMFTNEVKEYSLTQLTRLARIIREIPDPEAALAKFGSHRLIVLLFYLSAVDKKVSEDVGSIPITVPLPDQSLGEKPFRDCTSEDIEASLKRMKHGLEKDPAEAKPEPKKGAAKASKAVKASDETDEAGAEEPADASDTASQNHQQGVEYVQSWVTLLNEARWDEWEQMFAIDVQFAVPHVPQGTSPKRLVIQQQARLAAFPDRKLKIENVFVTDNRISAEMIFTGTQTGALRSPLGDHAPSNRKVQLRESVSLEVVDGKVTEVHWYFDRLDLLLQLGAVEDKWKTYHSPLEVETKKSAA